MNPVRDIPCLHQSFPKPFKASENLPKAFHTSQRLLKPPKPFKASIGPKPYWVSQRLPTFQSIPKHPKASQSLPMPSFPKLPEATTTSQSLPETRWETYYAEATAYQSPLRLFKSFPKPSKAKASQSMTKPSKAYKTSQSLPKPLQASQNCP